MPNLSSVWALRSTRLLFVADPPCIRDRIGDFAAGSGDGPARRRTTGSIVGLSCGPQLNAIVPRSALRALRGRTVVAGDRVVAGAATKREHVAPLRLLQSPQPDDRFAVRAVTGKATLVYPRRPPEVWNVYHRARELGMGGF
jgi:hypothetical protein